MLRVGVDLGGTKIEAVAADDADAYRVLARRRIPTPKSAGGDGSGGEGGGSSEAYARIVEAVAALAAEVSAEGAASAATSTSTSAEAGGAGAAPPVGVCTPGSLLPGSGLIANSNTRCLAGRPFRRDLEKALGRPVLVENDANCFALAEAVLGAGRGRRTVFGAILGTGVGGGLVIDGRIHGGRAGMAGEWGHIALHPGGRPCYCGRRGCAEAYLSGPALEARWAELAASAYVPPPPPESDGRVPDPPPPPLPLLPPAGAPLAEVSAYLDGAAAAGRPLPSHAERWRDELVADFGAGLAGVVGILDPDAVVVGGGVSNMKVLYGAGARAVRAHSLSDSAAEAGAVPVPILRNELGDSAGAVGACML